MLKSLGGDGMCDTSDAISELYDLKYPAGLITLEEWSQLNKDMRAALVNLPSGEAAAKVDHSGQGEGLIAYIRLWSWYNANSSERGYEYRIKALSPDRCRLVSGAADAIERWESRLMTAQEGGANFTCAEGWKVSILKTNLPEALDKEVALRTAELGDSYERTRAFIMKYALQERAHSKTAMDASALT